MEEVGDRTIGGMNGPWALALKVMLATYPAFVAGAMAWATWITSETFANRYFRERGERVTPAEVNQLETRLKSDISTMELRLNTRLNALPPEEWRRRIIQLEVQNQITLQSLVRIETKLGIESPISDIRKKP